jgi:hypothetical protein
MKTLTLLACAGFLTAAICGCGKKEEAPPPTPPPPSPAPAAAPSSPAAEVKAVAETAAKTVESAATEAATQAQALIDRTKALLGEKQYQDALASVGQLASSKLTPEQQTLVSGLKTELTQMGSTIQKGITSLKDVVAKKDYAGGMTLVKDLANYQLTPQQKQVVDGLKLELQKLAGSQAVQEGANAVGGLLSPKP